MKLAPTPPVEKTSPKRRGSKSDARNRRLSRNQPGKRQFFPFSGKRVVLGGIELFALPLPCYLVEFLIQFHWLIGNVKKQNSSKRNYGLGGGMDFHLTPLAHIVSTYALCASNPWSLTATHHSLSYILLLLKTVLADQLLPHTFAATSIVKGCSVKSVIKVSLDL